MLRVVFAGTPEFAAEHLKALLAHPQIDVVAAYTQPDRPAGRGKKLQPSAVKVLALEAGIPVEQPASLRTAEAQQQLAAYNADVMVVVAYGLILPQAVLDTPRYGCINVHGSLLPRWRGAAPIQRAIWAGDDYSGVAIMQMEAGLDTGPVLASERLPIEATDTSASLYHKLAALGPQALITSLLNLPELQAQAKPQDDQAATYAEKLSKAEAKLDWQQSAQTLERWIRAFNPWPICWLVGADGAIIKVWHADIVAGQKSAVAGQILSADKHGIVIQTADAALRLLSLQPAGKKPMAVADFLNGRSDVFPLGQILSNERIS